MSAAPILDFEALRAATGYQRACDVERCLTKAGIRFFPGKDGVWTTVDLVNAAGGLLQNQKPANEPYSPDELF